MLYVDLKGERIPALGFGTWQLRGDTCREAVRDALQIGYRHIDTARMYNNELDVGRGIRDAEVPRDEIFLVTKIWPDELHPETVGPATQASLEALATDRIDLLLIHWPNPSVPLSETLDAMQSQQEAGHARYLGVSNFPPPLLAEAIAHTEIACNQVEYHPFIDQRELCELGRRHEVMVTAYSPLAKGRVPDHPRLQEIGVRYGKSATQVTLRWLVQQPGVSVIPRSADPGRRCENFDIFDFELTGEEMEAIFSLAS